MRVILTVSIIMLFSHANAESKFKCLKNAEIKALYLNSKKVEKVSICINHPIYTLMSYDCFKSDKCKAISQYKKLDKEVQLNAERGNPFHLKCSLANGHPTFIEYKEEKSWNKTAVCIFDDNLY